MRREFTLEADHAVQMARQEKRLEFSRDGIPIYDGDPALLDEYIDRSRNMVEIVKRSKDKDTRILTVALELRNCLRGDAYDFARKLSADDLAKAPPLPAGTQFSEKKSDAELMRASLGATNAHSRPKRAPNPFSSCSEV